MLSIHPILHNLRSPFRVIIILFLALPSCRSVGHGGRINVHAPGFEREIQYLQPFLRREGVDLQLSDRAHAHVLIARAMDCTGPSGPSAYACAWSWERRISVQGAGEPIEVQAIVLLHEMLHLAGVKHRQDSSGMSAQTGIWQRRALGLPVYFPESDMDALRRFAGARKR
jgi:hypothetical protein